MRIFNENIRVAPLASASTKPAVITASGDLATQDSATFRGTIDAQQSLGFTPVNKAGDNLSSVFTFENDGVRPNTRFVDNGDNVPPAIEFTDASLGSDAKSWRAGLVSGSFALSTATDDWGGVSDVLSVDRSGNTQINGVFRVYNPGLGAYQQILETRKSGWGFPTGTATRSSFATSTVTLEQLAERMKALIDDLIAHGLIGS